MEKLDMTFNYNSLTKKQRLTVDRMIEYEPSLRSANTIDRKLVWKIFNDLKGTENHIGYPVFLQDNTITRGLYLFPGPDATEVDLDSIQEKIKKPVKAKPKKNPLDELTPEEQMFYNEIISSGIEVKL